MPVGTGDYTVDGFYASLLGSIKVVNGQTQQLHAKNFYGWASPSEYEIRNFYGSGTIQDNGVEVGNYSIQGGTYSQEVSFATPTYTPTGVGVHNISLDWTSQADFYDPTQQQPSYHDSGSGSLSTTYELITNQRSTTISTSITTSWNTSVSTTTSWNTTVPFTTSWNTQASTTTTWNTTWATQISTTTTWATSVTTTTNWNTSVSTTTSWSTSGSTTTTWTTSYPTSVSTSWATSVTTTTTWATSASTSTSWTTTVAGSTTWTTSWNTTVSTNSTWTTSWTTTITTSGGVIKQLGLAVTDSVGTPMSEVYQYPIVIVN